MSIVKKSAQSTRAVSGGHLVHSLTRAVASRMPTLDRRAFLRRSGIGVGAGLAASQLSLVRPAMAAEGAGKTDGKGKVEVKRTVCSHCSVGCAIDAVVENGVWTRHEPVFDSPINLGAHCAKGAAIREHGHGDHRLRYPMKLVNGKYTRVSWDEALTQITDSMKEIQKTSGPDSMFVIGSSKSNNEQGYLLRKMMAFLGTNNCDHQARICHSTTVAGVANTWGYGAMTNSYNDMRNSKSALYIGSNAAEAHPVSLLHMLAAKEAGCKMIVVDPRYTRTAAKADQFVRLRSGTDVAFLFGLVYHIFKNGWEDKRYIDDRVWGMNKVKDEIMKQWNPKNVEEVTGIPEAEMYKAAHTMAHNRPGTIVWCMGQTQHTIGNNMTRASCILQLALGNVGKEGGGANIFRGHDNVQGVTDLGPNPDSLPGYYGLAEGSWKHFCRVWNVDFDSMKARFADKMMEAKGTTVSRWVDAVLENKENMAQANPVKGLFFWGHAPNSQTRGLDMKRAMDALDLLVVVDPYPTATAAMAAMQTEGKVNPNRAVYLLPASTQFECSGSVTASNRSVQWREKVIDPLFESLPYHVIMQALADKLGFGDEMSKNYKMLETKFAGKTWREPQIESILDEINKGLWTIGYTGQSPDRLKAHMRNMHLFDVRTLRATAGTDKETGYDITGDYFGLPWPCWGNPSLKHPGSPNLYQPSRHVMDGGSPFRARFGVEKDGESLLAADGSSTPGADIQMGYPEFDHTILKKLGWWDELTAAEKEAAEGKNWKTDLSGGMVRVIMKNHGCHPYGNARARTIVWNFPDPIPVHREQLYGNRPDLIAKYPTYDDFKTHWRLPTLYKSVQDKNVADGMAKEFPLVMTSGRLVEYEGGGEETRSNKWLAELQQENFVEIHPAAAAARGLRNGETVWLTTPTGAKLKLQTMVTNRVPKDTVFVPFHFSGWWQGKDMVDSYPEGTAPIVRGEAINTATTYGYDSVTMMQETKTTVCQVMKA